MLRYQLWSSALGAFVTEVGSDGTKLTTNVFAAGALIATQFEGGVEFVYTDPVTRTVGRTGENSTWWSREEYEPLGQKLELTQPQTPYVPQGDSPSGYDPYRWCGFENAVAEGDFWQLSPTCKGQLVEDPSFVIPNLWDVVVKRAAEPLAILIIRGGYDAGGKSPSDNALAYATGTTNKPGKKGAEADGGAPAASKPEIDIGEFDVNVSIGLDMSVGDGQRAEFGMPQNEFDVQSRFSDIIKAARNALSSTKTINGIKCADLFGGQGLAFLEAYEKSAGGKKGAVRFGEKDANGKKMSSDTYGRTSRDKSTKIGKDKYSVIVMNTTSPLFSSRTFGFPTAGATDFGHLTFVDFWAAALLHEIGHAIRNKFGEGSEKSGMIDPDGEDGLRSRANQKFVVDNCFPNPKSK